MRRRGRHLRLLLPVFAALLAASPAHAATIVNGDFESGTLQGWHVHLLTGGGNWFAYEGTATPISEKRGRLPVAPPPQGSHAAITDELTADTLILYQDVALPPGSSETLSLLAYYDSYQPIAVPTPDTLSVEEEALGGQVNQQFRIDLMRPEAPLESIAPEDVLETLFQTRPGDPAHMGPKRLSADLAAFAGQTVRLRVAVAAGRELLNAGVDAISVGSAGSGAGSTRSARFRVGKPRANRRNGTVALPIEVPGPGRLSAKGQRAGVLKKAALRVAGAGSATLHLELASRALVKLRRAHKLRLRVGVTYAPAGGAAQTATLPVVFKIR